MMSGDKNEGANHEYYVTASYAGKIQKASQVNVDVANSENQRKSKDDSAKFPATTDSKTKPQPDAKRTIKDAYFVVGAAMIKAMKDKNWNKIAELYNGPDYAINKYHTKMKNEYEKLYYEKFNLYSFYLFIKL